VRAPLVVIGLATSVCLQERRASLVSGILALISILLNNAMVRAASGLGATAKSRLQAKVPMPALICILLNNVLVQAASGLGATAKPRLQAKVILPLLQLLLLRFLLQDEAFPNLL